jgi:hypothetical protein
VFSGVETLLMVAGTPSLLVGVLIAVRAKHMGAWIPLIFSAITIVSLALTITNLGILFRLRFQGLIPLVILVSACGLPAEKVLRLFAYRHSRP